MKEKTTGSESKLREGLAEDEKDEKSSAGSAVEELTLLLLPIWRLSQFRSTTVCEEGWR